MQNVKLKISSALQSFCFILATLFAPTASLAGELVGNFSGQFDVAQGNATYRIPVQLPKGPAGMKPSLALVYNSGSGGDGTISRGWALSGVSKVTRCPKTVAQDGEKGSINYDSNDRFCLGGQRLVLIKGQLGADGSEYRTEIDNHDRITAHGQRGGGPAYWKVQRKSGLTLVYGKTADSKLIGSGQSGSVHFWSLSRTEDRMGNAINYVYHNKDEEFYLSQVSYADRTIELVHKGMENFKRKYHNAELILKQNHRLSSVKVSVNYSLIRTYSLIYERDLLTQVKLIHADGSAFKPVRFDYRKKRRDGYGDENIFLRVVPEFEISDWGDKERTWWIDFNGDGKSDFCRASSKSEGMICSLMTSKGFEDVSLPVSRWGGKDLRWWIDFNGDGKQDFCRAETESGGNMICSLSTGRVFEEISLPVDNWAGKDLRWWVDFNGDGKRDFCRAEDKDGGNMICSLSTGRGFENIVLPVDNWSGKGLRWWTDFNGDGKSDFCRAESKEGGNMICSLSTGRGVENISLSVDDWGNNKDRRWWADFNGDGKQDYCRSVEKAAPGVTSRGNDISGITEYTRCSISTGESLQDIEAFELNIFEINEIKAPGSDHIESSLLYWWQDINGDGKKDYCGKHVSLDEVRCLLSNGENASESVFFDVSDNGDKDRRWWGDLNGDGKADYCEGVGERLKCYLSLANHYRLSSVNAGGLSVEIEYSPLEKYSVAKTRIDNGVGGKNETAYSYHGLERDPHGRGSRGYGRIETNSLVDGKKREVEFYREFPLTGQTRGIRNFLNEKLLSQTDFVYQSRDGANSKIKQFWLSRKTKESHALNSSFVKRTESAFKNIDAYGNVGEIEVNTTGDGLTYFRTTTNSYDNDKDKWLLGQLKSSQVVSKHPDGSELTQKSSFEYYPETGLLRSTTVEPDSKLALKTEYFYDRFGNKERIEKTGLAGETGVATRGSKVAYDKRGINVVSITNALGHTETYGEHDLLDNPRVMTGPNGLSSRWEYDGAGRKVKETRADGTTTTWKREWTGSGAFAGYKLTVESSGRMPETKVFDSMGRVVRSVSVGFDGQVIYKDIEYDELGRIQRRSLPYVAPRQTRAPYITDTMSGDSVDYVSGNYYNDDNWRGGYFREEDNSWSYGASYVGDSDLYLPHFQGEEIKWIAYAYDALGRQIAVRRPGSTGETISSEIRYAGLTNSHVDVKGRVKTVLKNLVGKTIKVTDPAGGIIRYKYDAAGRLKKTIDAGGQVVELDYDERGNKKFMSDPDMGVWRYRHNAFGELIWQKDAKGQIMKIKYDALGRMTERTEAEGTAVWTYDQTERGVGKLFELKGADGYVKRYGYDWLGRPSSTTILADGESRSVLTAYDDLGRIEFQVWPENFRLYRRYNRHGFLSALQSPKKESVDGFDKEELKNRMEQALDAATEAQRMAWSNRVQKLRYYKKA